MGKTVWKQAYEIIGDGIAVAEAHYAEVDAAHEAHWAMAQEFGAVGYRPTHNGTIKSLLFDDMAPKGFRKIGRDKGKIECLPHRGTKAGKEAAARLAESVRIPSDGDLANQFGWNGRSPFDGRLIYSAVAVRVLRPSARYFLRLPRETDDGWEQPATLKEIPESEMMRAVEAHNDAARAEREAKQEVADAAE